MRTLPEHLLKRHVAWRGVAKRGSRSAGSMIRRLFSVLNFDKNALHHFAVALGLPTPRRLACAPTLAELPAAVRAAGVEPTSDSFVIKKSRGTSARQVFVLHRGLELLRQRRMSLDAVLREFSSAATAFRTLPNQTYFRRSADGADIDTVTYVAEELVFDGGARAAAAGRDARSPPPFARDVKLAAFGRTVPYMVHMANRTVRGAAFDNCLMCEHTAHGCVHPGGAAVECYRIDEHLRYRRGRRVIRDDVGLPASALLPPPAHAGAMRAVAELLGGALGAYVRVDFFEAARWPLLSELTFFPAAPKQREMPGWVQDHRAELAQLLGSFWRGPEGGGPLPRAPCWLPPRFEGVLMSCAGLRGRSVAELGARYCTAPADAEDLDKWRRVAAGIAAAYAPLGLAARNGRAPPKAAKASQPSRGPYRPRARPVGRTGATR